LIRTYYLPAGEARIMLCSVTLFPLESIDDHYYSVSCAVSGKLEMRWDDRYSNHSFLKFMLLAFVCWFSFRERGVAEEFINLREGFDKGKRRTSRKKAKQRLDSDIVFWTSQIKFRSYFFNLLFITLFFFILFFLVTL
jgi:hypothetical protein